MSAAKVDRESPLPLWAQLHEDLCRRLSAGEFASAFPGELVLVEEYGVSRHTVREALRRLREDGVVSAQRGRPPRVVDTDSIEQPLGVLYSLFASVEATGKVQRSEVRALDIRRDETVAARLDLAVDAPLVYLERLRLADAEPLALDRAWLPARIARSLLKADFSHTALYDELERRCGVRVTGGREQVHAVVPVESMRMLLGIPKRVAAFSIDRLSYSDGRPIEWRQTVVRADRFSLLAEFSRVPDGRRAGLRLATKN
jgi:GntR family transcriptional regulator